MLESANAKRVHFHGVFRQVREIDEKMKKYSNRLASNDVCSWVSGSERTVGRPSAAQDTGATQIHSHRPQSTALFTNSRIPEPAMSSPVVATIIEPSVPPGTDDSSTQLNTSSHGISDIQTSGDGSGAVTVDVATLHDVSHEEAASNGSFTTDAPSQASPNRPIDVTVNKYKAGDKVMSMWQGKAHETEIVDRRESETKPGGTDYYVHYAHLDRRLDRWICEDEILNVAVASNTSSDQPSGAQPKKQGRRVTRRDKRKFSSMENPNMDGDYAAMEKEHEERTKVKNIYTIQISNFMVDTWYWSPYPEPYRNCSKLYLCEYCLKYMRKSKSLEKHKLECKLRHPPGDEIYRDKNISVFEVHHTLDPGKFLRLNFGCLPWVYFDCSSWQ